MRQVKIAEAVKATGGILRCGNEEAQIEQVILDSRLQTEHGLFVPIIGERNDGHCYIAGAVENGATAVFLASSFAGAKEVLEFCKEKQVAVIEVENTVDALQQFASWYRDRFAFPVIGITGSVGKTTTKEMVSAALSTKKRVLKTIGNRNSQLGLTIMMF